MSSRNRNGHAASMSPAFGQCFNANPALHHAPNSHSQCDCGSSTSHGPIQAVGGKALAAQDLSDRWCLGPILEAAIVGLWQSSGRCPRRDRIAIPTRSWPPPDQPRGTWPRRATGPRRRPPTRLPTPYAALHGTRRKDGYVVKGRGARITAPAVARQTATPMAMLTPGLAAAAGMRNDLISIGSGMKRPHSRQSMPLWGL